jgi:cell division protein ZapA
MSWAEISAMREQTMAETTEDAMMQPSRPVSVEIYDQVYHLRGPDPAHIEQLAAIVDAKMRAVAAGGTTVDSLRVAVLASLNIADELLAARARYDALAGAAGRTEESMRSRADSLAGLLDEVLDPARRAG